MFINIASILDYSTLFLMISDSGAMIALYIYNTGIRAWVTTEEFNSYFPGGDVTLTPGSWDHIAFERDGGSLTIYLNGALVGDVSDIGSEHMPLSGSIPVQMGAGFEQYDGHIDEFRFKLEAVPPSSFPPTQPY
jgi:hypothetical protein